MSEQAVTVTEGVDWLLRCTIQLGLAQDLAVASNTLHGKQTPFASCASGDQSTELFEQTKKGLSVLITRKTGYQQEDLLLVWLTCVTDTW